MRSAVASASCGANERNAAGNGTLDSRRSSRSNVPGVPNALSIALANVFVGGRW